MGSISCKFFSIRLKKCSFRSIFVIRPNEISISIFFKKISPPFGTMKFCIIFILVAVVLQFADSQTLPNQQFHAMKSKFLIIPQRIALEAVIRAQVCRARFQECSSIFSPEICRQTSSGTFFLWARKMAEKIMNKGSIRCF